MNDEPKQAQQNKIPGYTLVDASDTRRIYRSTPEPLGFPKVVGNALITEDGQTFQLRLLDKLYFRIGIVDAKQLERIYSDRIPTKGC